MAKKSANSKSSVRRKISKQVSSGKKTEATLSEANPPQAQATAIRTSVSGESGGESKPTSKKPSSTGKTGASKSAARRNVSKQLSSGKKTEASYSQAGPPQAQATNTKTTAKVPGSKAKHSQGLRP